MRGQHCHQPANHSSPEDGHGVAEDDEAVVEQELVGAALAVVRDHVRRVVQEVSDGEADQAVAGHRVAPLQVRHHVRGLQRGSIGNGLQIDIYRLLISRFISLILFVGKANNERSAHKIFSGSVLKTIQIFIYWSGRELKT